jgi:hypothetical protein
LNLDTTCREKANTYVAGLVEFIKHTHQRSPVFCVRAVNMLVDEHTWGAVSPAFDFAAVIGLSIVQLVALKYAYSRKLHLRRKLRKHADVVAGQKKVR